MIYGYLRVSSDEQDVNSQKQGVVKFAEAREWHIDEYITERSMEKPFPRIAPAFETEGEAYITKSSYTDIDTNGHVNNIRYSTFVLNALDLPPEKEITSFRIDFIKEIVDGASIKITNKTEDGVILCRGESERDGEFTTSFIAKLEIK